MKYNQKGSISETYVGKTDMLDVNQIKYFGFIISCDGTNKQNIYSKKIKSINTTRQILNMLQGWECGSIYLNSLRRGSALYASALLRSIEGGVLIGIKCKIKGRAFIWSPLDPIVGLR